MNYILCVESFMFFALIVAYIFLTSNMASKNVNLAEAGAWIVWATIFQFSKIKTITFFIGLGIIALVKLIIVKNERRNKTTTH